MIDNIDLKAMRMLIDLNETRNTYVTAERLDLSQSAVARMLSKCRTTLNDPIFVRSAGKLQPTSFAEHLLSRLPTIIDEIDYAVSANQKFDPAHLKGKIQICINRPIQSRFGAELFNRLSAEAPNATWYLKSWESNAVEQILDGRVLMGVNYYSDHFPKSITQKVVAKDQFVMLASENHPLSQLNSVSVDDALDYGFISLTLPGWDEKNTHLNRIFNDTDRSPKIRLQTDSLNLAMQVARTSNMLLPASAQMNTGYTGLVPLKLDLTGAHVPNSNVVISVAYKNANKPIVSWLNQLLANLVKDQNL